MHIETISHVRDLVAQSKKNGRLKFKLNIKGVAQKNEY